MLWQNMLGLAEFHCCVAGWPCAEEEGGAEFRGSEVRVQQTFWLEETCNCGITLADCRTGEIFAAQHFDLIHATDIRMCILQKNTTEYYQLKPHTAHVPASICAWGTCGLKNVPHMLLFTGSIMARCKLPIWMCLCGPQVRCPFGIMLIQWWCSNRFDLFWM